MITDKRSLIQITLIILFMLASIFGSLAVINHKEETRAAEKRMEAARKLREEQRQRENALLQWEQQREQRERYEREEQYRLEQARKIIEANLSREGKIGLPAMTVTDDMDEYEDWEDYYYDNEDDLRFYYGH